MYDRPEFNDDHTPIAYLISFRSYGTWLHGDARGSVDRFHNTYGTPKLPAYSPRVRYERSLMKQPSVVLNQQRRSAIRMSVEETCKIRNWILWAFNTRTEHVHSVVTAPCKPKKVQAALKANATRSMKEHGCWASDRSPWAYGGSRVYLWTEKELYDAIDYVLYYQGEDLP
jgi:REP element-mobilizing transposase RayT